MAVYLIIDSEIHDPEAYKAYLEAAPAFLKKHDGEYLVRGGDFTVIKDDWQPTRLLLFQFPDRQAIDSLMNDPDYQPWKKLRESVSKTKNSIVVDGVSEPV